MKAEVAGFTLLNYPLGICRPAARSPAQEEGVPHSARVFLLVRCFYFLNCYSFLPEVNLQHQRKEVKWKPNDSSPSLADIFPRENTTTPSTSQVPRTARGPKWVAPKIRGAGTGLVGTGRGGGTILLLRHLRSGEDAEPKRTQCQKCSKTVHFTKVRICS